MALSTSVEGHRCENESLIRIVNLMSAIAVDGLLESYHTAGRVERVRQPAYGASDYLVEKPGNGYLFKSVDTDQLAQGLINVSSGSPNEWESMSRKSVELARQFTPEKCATTLMKNNSL